MKESAVAAAARETMLGVLQKEYLHFLPFLEDVMSELGFGVTDIQADIAGYIEHGPEYLMVQAQRSQAKTTIAAAYCVWSLIHNPKLRVLIISAGGSQASDISTLIVRIIMTMDVLACLRPDKTAGDRSSTEAFDVHHSLKGLEKSPSVKCMGITANMQGNRADLLLADDIESAKNSQTAVMRAQLLHLTKDFTSIVQKGRIIWLGTPQTGESIYNSLPSRGVAVRIWPGRYPTVEQEEHYAGALAPLIRNRMLADPSLRTGGGILGDQGKPIDPVLLDEEQLQKKERDQGLAYFQLQHMLCTKMLDAMRFPLKPEHLCVVQGAGTIFPVKIVRGMENWHREPYSIETFNYSVMRPQETSRETAKLSKVWATIDPAAGGANGDETGYAIGGFLNDNIVALEVSGIPGGYALPLLEELAERLMTWDVEGVTIEKNMGYGAFAVVFTPILQAAAKKRGRTVSVEEELVTGQKEARLISTLSPVMGRGSLIVTPHCLEYDGISVERYAPQQRLTYSLLYQMSKLTAQRNALAHDDRLDALEALVRKFQAVLAKDKQDDIEKLNEKARLDLINSALKQLGAPLINQGRTSMLRRARK